MTFLVGLVVQAKEDLLKDMWHSPVKKADSAGNMPFHFGGSEATDLVN